MSSEILNNKATAALFLASRRSFPPKLMQAPYPEGEVLMRILTSGMRIPDHKKLEPWRVVVLRGQALKDLADVIADEAPRATADPMKAQKTVDNYRNAGLVLAVIYAPVADAPVPDWEQFASATALCLSLVNAALAEGFAAAWLSGLPTENARVASAIGATNKEKIVGLIHMGSCAGQPPERPRPDLTTKVSFPEGL